VPSEPTDLLAEALAVVSSIKPAEPDVIVRIRRAIDVIAIPALVADDRLRLQAVNAAAATLTGYSMAELLGLTVADITHVSDETVMEPLWRAFLATGRQRGRYEIVTRSGARMSVEYAAVRISPGLHLSLLRRDDALRVSQESEGAEFR
jgi:PAS domain S-box-containing protein